MSARDLRPAALGAHATADELARFVIDVLEPVARRRLERHVAACAACACALATEAAAEETLVALWPEVRRPLAPVLPLRPPAPAPAPPVPAPAARRRGLLAAGVGNALAAAVVAAIFIGSSAGRRSSAPVAGTQTRAVVASSADDGALLCRLPSRERLFSRLGDGLAMCALGQAPPAGDLCEDDPSVRSCLVR